MRKILIKLRKELEITHKQFEKDLYPFDPVLFYWFIPACFLFLYFIYGGNK
jgi:hypothetical protein